MTARSRAFFLVLNLNPVFAGLTQSCRLTSQVHYYYYYWHWFKYHQDQAFKARKRHKKEMASSLFGKDLDQGLCVKDDSKESRPIQSDDFSHGLKEDTAPPEKRVKEDIGPERTIAVPVFLSDGRRLTLPISLLVHVWNFVRQNVASLSEKMKGSSLKKEAMLEGTSVDASPKIHKKGNKEVSSNVEGSEGKGQPQVYPKATSSGVSAASTSTPLPGWDVNAVQVVDPVPWEKKESKSKGYWKKKRKASSQSEVSSEQEVKKTRPNYFVSVQITDKEILETTSKIHTHILENSEVDLSPILEGTHKFHITLMVMNLSSEEDLMSARSALDNCAASISARTSGLPVQLDFEGLGVFNKGKVLFACLKDTEGLEHLHFIADDVRKQMEKVGILTTDSRPFNPHLTLSKFHGKHNWHIRKKGINTLQEHLYKPFTNEVFGSQKVKAIQLCSMEKKREDGYYFVAHEVAFAS